MGEALPRRLILGCLTVLAIVAHGARPAGAQGIPDADSDGLPDAWEEAYGLDPQSAAAPNGADDDPDRDGASNLAELTAGTHPRGFHARRLAEGVDNAFFHWRLALAN